eukprot:3741212-Pleurochrysis_carterae.AAC.1
MPAAGMKVGCADLVCVAVCACSSVRASMRERGRTCANGCVRVRARASVRERARARARARACAQRAPRELLHHRVAHHEQRLPLEQRRQLRHARLRRDADVNREKRSATQRATLRYETLNCDRRAPRPRSPAAPAFSQCVERTSSD